jgi:hypothetical protein
MKPLLTIFIELDESKQMHRVFERLSKNMNSEMTILAIGRESEVLKYQGQYKRIDFLAYESIENHDLYDGDITAVIHSIETPYVYFADHDVTIVGEAFLALLIETVKAKADIGIGISFNTSIGTSYPECSIEQGVISLETHPQLIRDAWTFNKIVSVGFIKKNNIRIRNTDQYSRTEFITKMLLNARVMIFMNDVVTLWNQKSRANDENEIYNKFGTMNSLLRYADEIKHPEKANLLKKTILERDIAFLLNTVDLTKKNNYLDNISSMLKKYPIEDLLSLSMHDRLLCFLVREELWEDFEQVKSLYVESGTLEGDRIYSDMQYFLSKEIPKEIFDLTLESTLCCKLEEVTCDSNVLHIKGSAFVEYLYQTNYDEVLSEFIFITPQNEEIKRVKLSNINKEDITTFPSKIHYDYCYFDEQIEIGDIKTNTVHVYLELAVRQSLTKKKYLVTLTKDNKWEIVVDGKLDSGIDKYRHHLPDYFSKRVEKSKISKDEYTIIGLCRVESDMSFASSPIVTLSLENKASGQSLKFNTRFFIPKKKVKIDGVYYVNYPAYKATIKHSDNKLLLKPKSIWSVMVNVGHLQFPLTIEHALPKKTRARFRSDSYGISEYCNMKKNLELHVNSEESILEEKIKRMEKSLSWRITKPIRAFVRWMKKGRKK